MSSDQEKYNELSLYTLEHKDISFIHQYIVDTYIAQHFDENTKPISLAFALIGLYLHVEKKYSGREIQQAHSKMGNAKKEWTNFTFPEDKGDITVEDVVKILPGAIRDQKIDEWSMSVWGTWKESHQQVRELARSMLGV